MENIVENNKLIAEFMGVQYLRKPDMFDENRILESYAYKGHPGNWRVEQNTKSHFTPTQLMYQTEWDWLMPVIDKIEKIKLGDLYFNDDPYLSCVVEFEIIVSICRIHLYGDMKAYKNFIDVEKEDTKLEATYKAVVEFIKWYNKTNLK